MRDHFENIEQKVNKEKTRELIAFIDDSISTLEGQRRNDGEMIASFKRARRKYSPPSVVRECAKYGVIVMASFYLGMAAYAGHLPGSGVFEKSKPVAVRKPVKARATQLKQPEITKQQDIIRYAPKQSDPVRWILYPIEQGDTSQTIAMKLYGTAGCKSQVDYYLRDKTATIGSYITIPDTCKRKA